ncbi:hypothetical protein CRENBAI_006372, partial [Crenichthys baileyi]
EAEGDDSFGVPSESEMCKKYLKRPRSQKTPSPLQLKTQRKRIKWILLTRSRLTYVAGYQNHMRGEQ